MRLPQFSLAGLMVVIALVGAEIALVRFAVDSRSPSPLPEAVAIASPMITILAYGLYSVRQRGPARPFWLGFLLAGSLATALMFVLLCIMSSILDPYSDYVAEPVVNNVLHVFEKQARGPGAGEGQQTVFWCVEVPLVLMLYSLPSLVPAVVSGWLLSHYRNRGRRSAAPMPGGGEMTRVLDVADAVVQRR